ncbi:uncharacterized, partial [Tachysurus ichikawai]
LRPLPHPFIYQSSCPDELALLLLKLVLRAVRGIRVLRRPGRGAYGTTAAPSDLRDGGRAGNRDGG